jgi:hypothetical protein
LRGDSRSLTTFMHEANAPAATGGYCAHKKPVSYRVSIAAIFRNSICS